MKIGICGLGFVGSAIEHFFNDVKTKTADVLIYDKYKHVNDLSTILAADIVFVCLPTPFSYALNTYAMDELNGFILALNEAAYRGIILIKSTVLPSYCQELNTLYPALFIIHNPEFLSARTAQVDFAHQAHIVLGFTLQSTMKTAEVKAFYNEYFPTAQLSITTSECSAIMKLGCNSFYAVKIQFFTELYYLCERLALPYNEVKELMLKNNWIHPQHTNVPGSDGKVSFGGACLPKDLAALEALLTEVHCPNQVLSAALNEQREMRDL